MSSANEGKGRTKGRKNRRKEENQRKRELKRTPKSTAKQFAKPGGTSNRGHFEDGKIHLFPVVQNVCPMIGGYVLKRYNRTFSFIIYIQQKGQLTLPSVLRKRRNFKLGTRMGMIFLMKGIHSG